MNDPKIFIKVLVKTVYVVSELCLLCRNMNVGIPPVVLKASRKHTATLIFLHGLGDTGMGWAGALNTIKPDYLKVI